MTNLPGTKQRHLLCHSLWLWLLSIVVMSGCYHATTQHSYHSFAHEVWEMQDTVDFEVTTADSLIHYTLAIDLRNTNDFPYQDLPIFITCTEGDSLPLLTDTLSLSLANESGSWRGKGMGGLYQTTHHAGMLHFSHTGSHHIRIAHLLPDTLLKGISDIGIRLEEVNAYRDRHQYAGK